jgi:hypothetical protein
MYHSSLKHERVGRMKTVKPPSMTRRILFQRRVIHLLYIFPFIYLTGSIGCDILKGGGEIEMRQNNKKKNKKVTLSVDLNY